MGDSQTDSAPLISSLKLVARLNDKFQNDNAISIFEHQDPVSEHFQL